MRCGRGLSKNQEIEYFFSEGCISITYTSHTCWQDESQWCFLRWLSRFCGAPEVYCSSTDEWRQGWEASVMRGSMYIYVCLMHKRLPSLIYKEECSRKANWVVFNFGLFTAVSFCIAAVLKVLCLTRTVTAPPVIAWLRDWTLPEWHNIFSYRDRKMQPRDKTAIHGAIVYSILVLSSIPASEKWWNRETIRRVSGNTGVQQHWKGALHHSGESYDW